MIRAVADAGDVGLEGRGFAEPVSFGVAETFAGGSPGFCWKRGGRAGSGKTGLMAGFKLAVAGPSGVAGSGKEG